MRLTALWRAATSYLTTGGYRPVGTFDLAPRPIDRLLLALSGASDAIISRADAMTVPAMVRARNMLCSVATLPLAQRDPLGRVTPNPLFTQLDPNVANVVTLAETLEDLVLDGVAWWRITALGWDNFPSSVRRLDPATVSLTPPGGAVSPAPLPSGLDARPGVIYIDGREVPASDVIRFDSPNPPVLKVAARALRRAVLLDKAAAMYSDNPRPLDYFTPAEGVEEYDDDEIGVLLAQWQERRKSNGTGYVPRALTYNSVDSPSPRDLQLVELQAKVTLDIANALGVDPEDLGVSTTSRTYANDVDRRRNRVNEVFAPYMRAITDRLSMPDVTRRGYVVQFELGDYLKSNPTERATVQKMYLDMGVLVAEEIRAMEGYGPMPEGATPAPAPAAKPAAVAASVVRALREPSRPMSLAASHDRKLTGVDLPMESFAVDTAKRTITGVALPYGKVGVKFGLKFRFAKDAIQWGEIGRVKMLRDHDPSQAMGVTTKLANTGGKLTGQWRIARGAAGDDALQLADDGVLDGLSVGVDWEAEDETFDERTGVLTINRATLREVTLTAMPVFDDARVTAVAASHTERTAMEPCATCGTVHAAGVACPTQTPPPAATFSAEQLAQITAALRPPAPPAAPPAPEQRGTVDPTTRTLGAQVTEPAPYTFDRQGNLRKGTHDFSSDLFAGWRSSGGGDQAARDRVQAFIREQFAITPANVTNLNYPPNRPDMYVDQMEYQYPVYDAVNKGTLEDVTPFVVPKFNTATGLVADHVTGTEPTPGTFTATAQTITPSAVSGKVEITREAWDQGGNPQMSGLIWRQMYRGYYEALEAYAVAQLAANAASITDLTVTTAAVDGALDAALGALIVPLQYIRGGNRFRKVFTQIDLYKAMAAAKDTTGRRLYPELGPVNSVGTVEPAYRTIHAHGIDWIPAWATAASGSVAASSWMFDPEKVCLWASAPQRIDVSWRVAWVDLGIWGYKAFAITDFNGTREVVYDPI
jgi:HK97 family phage prohead protease